MRELPIAYSTAEVRARHKEALVAYFNRHENRLDEDSLRRLSVNPLRILDSKNKDMSDLIKEAPTLMDFFDEASQQHFEQLCALLDQCGFQVGSKRVGFASDFA